MQSVKPKMLKFYLEVFLNAWILKIYYLEVFLNAWILKIYYLKVFFCPNTLSFGNILGGGGGGGEVELFGGEASLLR